MSYCRFENTYSDLLDCLDHIDQKASNERDERYRVRLVDLLKRVNDEYDLIEDLDEEDEDVLYEHNDD